MARPIGASYQWVTTDDLRPGELDRDQVVVSAFRFGITPEGKLDRCIILSDDGRPDLAQKTNKITMDDLAGMMYDSLQHKIMPLADEVIVYPAHVPVAAVVKTLALKPSVLSVNKKLATTLYNNRAGKILLKP